MDALQSAQELGYWYDALVDEVPPAQRSAFSEAYERASGGHLQGITARMIAWQLEDKRYGLNAIRAVRQDPELSGFCRELVALYNRELVEAVSQDEFSALYERVSKAWAVAGEREKVRGIATARKWAWLGARKWAWIPRRGWRQTWVWLIAGSRSRNRTAVAGVISAWDAAFKWSLKGRRARRAALAGYFLSILTKS
jgi:hypothetical protein